MIFLIKNVPYWYCSSYFWVLMSIFHKYKAKCGKFCKGDTHSMCISDVKMARKV